MVKMKLREAVKMDCRLLFDWANEPAVRQNSINTGPIVWEDHQKWFKERLESNGRTKIFIAEDMDRLPVGQIRFERKGNAAEVNFSVDAEHRGRGIGSFLLQEGIRKIIEVWHDVDEVIGTVKKDNAASIRKFEESAFKLKENGALLKYSKNV